MLASAQVYTDEREVQVSERLTEEAIRVCIEEAGVAEPVFDQVRITPRLSPPARVTSAGSVDATHTGGR